MFENDALKNKLACNHTAQWQLVLLKTMRQTPAAKAFVTHLIETVGPEDYDEVFGVICSPSHVSFTDKSNLAATLRGQVNAIMVVTEPFATAYGIEKFLPNMLISVQVLPTLRDFTVSSDREDH